MLSALTRIIPLKLYRSLAGRPLLPYYHTVSDEELPLIRHLYKHKSVAAFTRDMEFLARSYTPVSLQELLAWVKDGTSLPSKAMHLSFDDGFRECHDIVAPILKEKGIPATFFITTGLLDNRRMFYKHVASLAAETMVNVTQETLTSVARGMRLPASEIVPVLLSMTYPDRASVIKIAELCAMDVQGYLKEHQPYLSSEQVKSLIADGFTIGAHGVEHEDFAFLDTEEQVRVTMESVDEIQSAFHLPYRVFSFPFNDGAATRQYVSAIRDDVDLVFGNANMKTDIAPFVLQRTRVEDPATELRDKLKVQYARYLFRKWTGKGTVVRRDDGDS